MYRVRQGYVSINTSRKVHERVQDEVQLVPLISCWSNIIPLAGIVAPLKGKIQLQLVSSSKLQSTVGAGF